MFMIDSIINDIDIDIEDGDIEDTKSNNGLLCNNVGCMACLSCQIYRSFNSTEPAWYKIRGLGVRKAYI